MLLGEALAVYVEADEWIEEKYESGYWEGFIIRIAMNQFYGRRTRFEKLYHQPIGLYQVDDVVDEDTFDVKREFMNFAIAAVIKDMDWYHKKIWKLYTEGGENIKPRSGRSISRATGVGMYDGPAMKGTFMSKHCNCR